jgi:hypothetical protein
MSGLSPETRAVLEAVREAVAIPRGATAGDEIRRAGILDARVRHLEVFLRFALDVDRSAADLARSVAYLRGELAKHPAEGYRTWDEAAPERRAAEGGGQ